MSKSKKRFNKKQGLRFTLLHRSQQDPLYYDEEEGSKFILHPADRKTAEIMQNGLFEQEGTASYVTSESASNTKQELAKKRQQQVGAIREFREVDEYGLPLDGYDYSKHLSTLGGGAFIAADGSRVENVLPVVQKAPAEEDVLQMLPDTIFASQTEQPRLLEAITLRPENMDPDMKRQLGLLSDDEMAGEEEEELEDEDDDSAATGEWGDLQDDFMAQIIAGGVVVNPDDDESTKKFVTAGDGAEFDFDAHMARLMKEAEEEDAEDEDEEDEDFELDRGRSRMVSGSVVDRPRRDVDEHFEAVLAAEYDDDDDDDEEEEEVDEEQAAVFEEEEEEGTQGAEFEEPYQEDEDEDEEGEEDGDEVQAMLEKMQLANQSTQPRKRSDLESRSTNTRKSKRAPMKLITQDDPVFQQAIKEFLDQKADDTTLGDVAHPPPAAETMRLVTTKDPSEANGDDGRAVEIGDEDEDDDEEEHVEPNMEDFMKMWGTYTITPKPQFDCQTIVSTRSTIDNIPSQIVVENTKQKKKKQQSTSTAVLPPVDEEADVENDDAATVESLTRDVAKLALRGLSERAKNETAEERKARKAKLKELQRDRRAQKKQTTTAFKKERAQVLHAMMAPNAPRPGVSEFKIG